MNILAIDVGGTYIKSARVINMNIVGEVGCITTPKTFEEFIRIISNIIEEHSHHITGIAFSLPGRIDNVEGYAYSSGALGYLDRTDLNDVLKTITTLPVSFDNDGKCAVHAELKHGSLAGKENGIMCVFGTGLGGGIVMNGALCRGSNFAAGEFSFIGGSQDAVGSSIGKCASIYTLLGHYKKLSGKDCHSGHDFFEALNKNDNFALDALSRFSNDLTEFFYNMQSILDPELFVIGGGVSSQPQFIEYLQKEIDDKYIGVMTHLKKPKLIVSTFKNNANLIGACLNFETVSKKSLM